MSHLGGTNKLGQHRQALREHSGRPAPDRLRPQSDLPFFSIFLDFLDFFAFFWILWNFLEFFDRF